MERLAQALRDAEFCVAFTGAGVSTLSGISDFRGKDGLYQRMDAEKIFDLDYFYRHPAFYYEQTRDFLYNLDEKKPSLVHLELARLERQGIVRAVVTQNIDLLHQKAGSRAVVEIHGSPRIHSCLQCGRDFAFAEVAPVVRRGEIPRCPCGGVLKPGITFFGEALPARALTQAQELFRRADLALVLGSTLVVQPAASLPALTVRHGGALFLVNDMPTPLDRYAVARYEDLAATFQYLQEHLPGPDAS